MQEPMSAPVEGENMENEKPILEPLSAPAPVDMEPDMEIENSINDSLKDLPPDDMDHNMETENSIVNDTLEDLPPDDQKTKSLEPILIESSPIAAKHINNSFDIIEIQSDPASPLVENKENLEPKFKDSDPAAIIKSLKKIIFSLKTKSLRDISIAKKNTRRDIVDKMSANHKLSLSKERKNHLKLLRETRQLYEKRLSDVEKFYMEKIAVLEENRTVAFDALLESKITLEEQIKKSSDSLNSIINIISSYPSNVSTIAMESLPITKNIEKKDNLATENSMVEENENESKCSNKMSQLETEVYEQKLRITCLENKIKDEITSKGQIQQKLAYTEILYRATIREKDELIKNLQDDLANLKNSKCEMETRHKEQFTRYDRMLKRSEAEIALQKREVLALRKQFVPGTPTSFNPIKYKGTPSIIKQSTPSSSKISSNNSLLDASETKKVRLLNESTPSFCTAASSRSSPSGVLSVNQTATPSSKASRSLRSTKATSENSTNSSYAVFFNSDDDSEGPKQKSTRVLRNKRKRVVKSKKRL